MADYGDDYRCNMNEKELIRFSSLVIALFVSIPAWCLAAVYIPEIITVVFVICILSYYFIVSFKHTTTTLPILFVIYSLVALIILIGVFSFFAVHPERGFFCGHPKDAKEEGHNKPVISGDHWDGGDQSTDKTHHDQDCQKKTKYLTFICIFSAYAVLDISAIFLLYHLQSLLKKVKERDDLEAAEAKRPPLPTYEAALEADRRQTLPIYKITVPDLIDASDTQKIIRSDALSSTQPPPVYPSGLDLGVIPFSPPIYSKP